MVLPAFIRKTAVVSLLAASIAVVALPVLAAPGGRGGMGKGPCAEDAAKFCKDVERGGGKMFECFKEHENELSPACKQHVTEMKEKGRGSRQACKDDAAKFCKDVQPGGGRMMKCLKEHESELSEGCKARIASRGNRT